jgi:hypothetical protein
VSREAWGDLEEIMLAYFVRLGEEAVLLRQLVSRLATEADAKDELRRFLHRVAGTAGTYEVSSVFEAAKNLERTLHGGASDKELAGGGSALATLMEETSRQKLLPA